MVSVRTCGRVTDEQREQQSRDRLREPGAAGTEPRWPRSRPPCAAPSECRRASVRENVFELHDVDVCYGGMPAVAGRHDGHPPQRHHGADRPLGLRQEHAAALPQPDERPDPERRGQRASSSTTARTSTGPTSTRSQVRKLIGMVFQKPNPFPKSIYDNVAFGPRILGRKEDLDGTVEQALRGAALWDEVKDRLDEQRLRASPAASSSASASPAASPSSPT